MTAPYEPLNEDPNSDFAQRGNVLVIGNSGVGKSTLINAVLGEDCAKTGWGTEGTTKELAVYQNDSVPFRIIDTVGFEPSLLKEWQAIHAVQKWSKGSAKAGHEDNQINVIWFCVDGTAAKLFPKHIETLSRATALWKTVPVVVVITKSYAVPDRDKNMDMVNNAFAKQKRYAKNLRKVIPVVASTFVLNDSAYAAPEGITELLDVTNELLPEGIKAGYADISKYKLNVKRMLAHGLTGISVTSAATVGAVPIPFPDALILTPIEVGMINGLASIYEIKKQEEFKRLLNTIIEVGTVSVVAKNAITLLKAIPGINLAASVLNAITAGAIVGILGESSVYAFEQIYLGNKSVADIDWVKKLVESKFSSQFAELAKKLATQLSKNGAGKDDAKWIIDFIKVFLSRK